MVNSPSLAGLKAYLFELLTRYKIYIISLVIIAAGSALFSIFVKYQVKYIIDTIRDNPHSDAVKLVLLFMFYKIMHHMLHFIERLLNLHYKPKMVAGIVESAYTTTMEQSLHWFDSHLSGEIASKLTDLQDSIITIITCLYRNLINLAAIILGIIFLTNVSYQPAIVLIVFAIIYSLIMSRLLKTQFELQQQYVVAMQQAVGIINDSISNIFGIKVIGNVLNELRLKLRPAVANWADWDRKTRKFDAYYVDMTDTLLITLMMGAQISLTTYLYASGKLTAGDFAFIMMITLNIHTDLAELLEDILFQINPKIAAIKSSYQFIATNSGHNINQPTAKLPRVNGNIRYSNINFGYENGAKVFDQLSLEIKAGERVGIVGSSGAGKTTLIKCLLRYFPLHSGSIYIDDQDISQITEESLRANISIIPQDITMFHRTIIENLQIAKYDASLEEIIDACKKARIDEDIRQMPEGYNTIVGERGIKLSGGQRQRIAIARAILKNAPILILDEATSALDTPTELLIQQSINELFMVSKTTTIVIAHRLSTLLSMDRVLVFAQGKIVESGTHTELIQRNGLYKKLWEAQMGGFLGKEHKLSKF